MLAVFLAYRASPRSAASTANLEFLHEASRTLSHAPPTPRPASPALLAIALENFRAEVAEVSLFPADGDGEAGRGSRSAAPTRLEVMQPLDERVARELPS